MLVWSWVDALWNVEGGGLDGGLVFLGCLSLLMGPLCTGGGGGA